MSRRARNRAQPHSITQPARAIKTRGTVFTSQPPLPTPLRQNSAARATPRRQKIKNKSSFPAQKPRFSAPGAQQAPVQCHDIGNTCCQDMGYTFSDDDGFLVASKEAVMPWKALSMYEQRLALIHRIVTLKQAVGEVAKEFGGSRKTVHKWLRRYPGHESVADRSRRPKRSPGKTCRQTEDQGLASPRRHNWRPRKLHRLLINQQQQQQQQPQQQQQRVPCDPPFA